jgi:hypothetical protein
MNRFVTLPIFAGEGGRLFEGISLEKLQLKLVEDKIFINSGSVLLRYPKQ